MLVLLLSTEKQKLSQKHVRKTFPLSHWLQCGHLAPTAARETKKSGNRTAMTSLVLS
jgi:hypothetical protein